MTEEEKTAIINAYAFAELKRVLKRLDNKKVTEEEFLGKCYAYMMAAEALGWNVSRLCLVAVDRGSKLREKAYKEWEQDENFEPTIPNLEITEQARDEIARILELVAQDGLPHPRNLDSAIDAIIEAISQI